MGKEPPVGEDTSSPALNDKCKMIGQVLEPFDRIAVAFSGGVDSAFIAWFAKNSLGKPVSLFFADTVFIASREQQSALLTAERLGVDLEVLEFDPLDSVSVRNNPVDRCYFCKKEVFSRILKKAGQRGCRAVVDGSHAGDAGGWRPGKKALAELGILSPLALAGLTKDEIRTLARKAGIPNWNKPSQSCLATRVPYGTPLSRKLLERIETAEDFLYALGCIQVRVRCHTDGVARIEAGASDFSLIASPENRGAIVKRFEDLEFVHIALDLAGFRSGTWDRGLV